MPKRVISTSLKMDGEAEFKRQMADVNREMRTLRSEMAYSEEQFKGQANTMEALTEKDKLLRREIEQQTEKVNALERALSDATEVYGENDKRTDGYRQSLLKAKTELVKMNRELEDNSKYLDEARRSADHTADSIDEFGREAKDAGDAFGDMGGGLGDLAGQFGNLKGMLAGGAVVGGALILCATAFGFERVQRVLTLKRFRTVVLCALSAYSLLKCYSFFCGANGLETIFSAGTPGKVFSSGLILPLNLAVGAVVACTMYGFYSLFKRGRI